MKGEWQSQAKCRGLGWEIFVPVGPGGSMARATQICNGEDGFPECPVKQECRDEGERDNRIGVWGGVVRSSRDFMKAEKRTRKITVISEVEDGRPRRSE